MAGGPDPDLADLIASPGLGMTGHNLARSFYAQLRVTPTPPRSTLYEGWTLQRLNSSPEGGFFLNVYAYLQR
jgi:hypothetical protein